MDDQTKEVVAKAELPKLMKQMRVALGLSQEELAKLSGISRQSVSYYETADAVPTMATLDKWLEAITKEIKESRRKGGKLSPESQNKAPVSSDEG